MEARARGEDDARACARCRRGFYCAEHAKSASSTTASTMETRATATDATATTDKRDVDPDAEQTCKNPGCGRKFRERDNADDACEHHSGAPIFHETKKGWSCCGKLVYDFDDFLKIVPCARGRHDADAKPLRFQSSAVKKK
jgi:disease resistance protein